MNNGITGKLLIGGDAVRGSYQDMPDALLPDALKAENPAGLNRRVDGRIAALNPDVS